MAGIEFRGWNHLPFAGAGFTSVYGGVRVGWVHLNLWWGPCWLGSPQFMVGSVLAGFTSVYGGVGFTSVYGGVRVGWVHLSLWWGPCCLGSP